MAVYSDSGSVVKEYMDPGVSPKFHGVKSDVWGSWYPGLALAVNGLHTASKSLAIPSAKA